MEDPVPASSMGVTEILQCVESLRQACWELEHQQGEHIRAAQPAARESARNLIHYLALRRRDLRAAQPALAELGLSSLGRSESHTMANLDAVARCLRGLARQAETDPPATEPEHVDIARGHALIEAAADRLLGAPPLGRAVRIMVTLAPEAADDPAFVGRLLDAGMTVARINSAHDSMPQWQRMCRNVREQAAQRGTDCRILFDLAGPKLRTGPIDPGQQVLRLKPVRDVCGRTVRPAEVLLVAGGQDAPPPGRIPVPAEWLEALTEGDSIVFEDARRKRRRLRVTGRDVSGAWRATCKRTAYIVSGTRLRRRGGRETVVGRLAATEQAITLRPGDHVTLLRELRSTAPPSRGPDGQPAGSAVIGCTLPEALTGVQPGHAIWFDDGKIGGIVSAVGAGAIEIKITDASTKGERLRADKGINLPDTWLDISGLTEKDRQALPFAAAESDLVGMSFVRDPEDVRSLTRELAALGGRRIGLILKIETRHAFENLPALLLAAMESPAAGVMIARGDLAVEMGYGRLAEVQEEILWMCEAAHVPVVWATQVLDTLARKGRPSRAEVTDAAMAVRAECVMLNKGPYIAEAVEFLDGVLRRMQEHQSKKSPMLRALAIAQRFGRAREARQSPTSN